MPEISRACAPQGETPAQWAAGAARRATPACHKERKLVRSNQDPVYQWREGKGREVKVGRSCSTLCNPMDIQSMEFSAPEYRSEGPNPGLPHYRQSLYQLSHKGSPRILKLVPFPFSSRSSRSRNGPGSPALQVDSLVQKWTNIFKKLICLFIFIFYYYYFFHFQISSL